MNFNERPGVKGSFRAGNVFLLPKRNDPRDTHWEERQSVFCESGNYGICAQFSPSLWNLPS